MKSKFQCYVYVSGGPRLSAGMRMASLPSSIISLLCKVK